MRHASSPATLPAILLSLATALGAAEADGSRWPGFRGPGARGVAEDGLPTLVAWDLAQGRGVLWATPLPGLAHSSPVAWGSSVFVTTAIAAAGPASLKVGLYGDIGPADDDAVQRFVLYRLDRSTGKVVWERTVHEGEPRQRRHTKSTHANPTPTTDGQRVVAFFGSEGLYCYDFDGRLLWKKDLGVLEAAFFQAPDAQWGFGSSPVIDDGVVYVQADVLKGGFLAAFDARDGRQLWRTPRSDVPTWSTPTIHDLGDRKLLLVNGWKHAGAYDARTGREVFKLEGQGDIPVPTPFVAEGLVFFTHAHGPGSPIYAVRADAKGDVTLKGGALANEFVAWSAERAGAYIPTPLVYRGLLYLCRDNGVLAVFRARTGERLYQERLGPGKSAFSASLVAADGKVYASSEDGDVYVVKAGETFGLLSTNAMNEVIMATPAIAGGTLFFRTRSRLVAVGSGPASR
jgi:outer membrane protein assembly factor BamB